MMNIEIGLEAVQQSISETECTHYIGSLSCILRPRLAADGLGRLIDLQE